jgi:hypothetical protein
METLFVLMAAAITLMALTIGEQSHKRHSPEPRHVLVPILTDKSRGHADSDGQNEVTSPVAKRQ